MPHATEPHDANHEHPGSSNQKANGPDKRRSPRHEFAQKETGSQEPERGPDIREQRSLISQTGTLDSEPISVIRRVG